MDDQCVPGIEPIVGKSERRARIIPKADNLDLEIPRRFKVVRVGRDMVERM